MKQWLVPLVLGTLVTAGMALLVPEPGAADPAPRGGPDDGVLGGIYTGLPVLRYPFPEPPVAWQHDNTTLTSTVMVPMGAYRPEAPCASNATNYPICEPFTYWTPHIAVTQAVHAPHAATCGFEMPCQGGAPYLAFELADGPFIGPGNWSFTATWFIFDETGLLVATNAPESDHGRFEENLDFTKASKRTFSLDPETGDSLPFFEAEARDALVGAPAGSVHSAEVTDHPYEWYMGPLYITARIDAVL